MARVAPMRGGLVMDGARPTVMGIRDKLGNDKLYGSAMAFARRGMDVARAQPVPAASPKPAPKPALSSAPKTLLAPDGSELGDLSTTRTPFLIAQDVLAGDVCVGLYKVVKFMKRDTDDKEVQMRGIKVLGIVAQQGLRGQRHRNKGQAHTGHFDRSHLSEISAALIKVGATTAVLDAMLAHHKDRIIVLRACWTLEHICGTTDTWTAFKTEGGRYVIKLVKQVHGGDKEIISTLNSLKKPQRGIVKPCFSYCSLT